MNPLDGGSATNITMVADNCHSSKAHKFVKFRSNFNHFVLEIK